MIINEPIYLNKDKIFMVYLASAVEYLSNKYKLKKPNWINKEKYINANSYYAFNTKIKDYQEYLKKNTPREFSKRNLFVGDNVLRRV